MECGEAGASGHCVTNHATMEQPKDFACVTDQSHSMAEGVALGRANWRDCAIHMHADVSLAADQLVRLYFEF